jgi:hypothetical protein
MRKKTLNDEADMSSTPVALTNHISPFQGIKKSTEGVMSKYRYCVFS